MLSTARTAAVNRKLENREEVKKRFARLTLRLSPVNHAHMERLSIRCVFRLFEPASGSTRPLFSRCTFYASPPRPSLTGRRGCSDANVLTGVAGAAGVAGVAIGTSADAVTGVVTTVVTTVAAGAVATGSTGNASGTTAGIASAESPGTPCGLMTIPAGCCFLRALRTGGTGLPMGSMSRLPFTTFTS